MVALVWPDLRLADGSHRLLSLVKQSEMAVVRTAAFVDTSRAIFQALTFLNLKMWCMGWPKPDGMYRTVFFRHRHSLLLILSFIFSEVTFNT